MISPAVLSYLTDICRPVPAPNVSDTSELHRDYFSPLYDVELRKRWTVQNSARNTIIKE